MTKQLATVAALIAARTWGGRWTASRPEMRAPGFDRAQGSREETNNAKPTA